MKTYRFLELVEKEKGFEFYQAFRDEVDWVIGGKGDTYCLLRKPISARSRTVSGLTAKSREKANGKP